MVEEPVDNIPGYISGKSEAKASNLLENLEENPLVSPFLRIYYLQYKTG